MRVNLYSHELPVMAARPEHVTTTADTGIAFHGLRLYTEPPREHEPGDDDSAAVTFWLPATRHGRHRTVELRRIAQHLLDFCDDVDAPLTGLGGEARPRLAKQERDG